MKLKNETIQEIVNNSNGEVFSVTTSKTFNIKVKSDEFYFTFLKTLGQLAGLKSIVDIKVLSCLCTIAEFNSGLVYLTSERKEFICNNMGLKYQSVANSLTSLKKNGFITGKGGTYRINPEYFWKGDLKSREVFMQGKEMDVDITFNI